MEVNKVVYNGDTLLDLTSDTVTPQTLLSGATAHAANGQSISGTVDLNGKADKVANATVGNFAGLDANGNLTDSGKKATDFATASDMSDVQEVIPSTATTQNKLATAADVTGEDISSTSTTSPVTDSADGMVQGITIYGRSDVAEGSIRSVGEGWGIIDLGDLNWAYDVGPSYARFITTAPPSDIKIAPSRTLSMLCALYTCIDDGRPFDVNFPDKSIYAFYTSSTIISVHDSSYSNAADFKNAMSGVLLCYPFADPTQGNAIAVKTDNGTGIDGTMAAFTTALPLRGVSDTVRDVMEWDGSAGTVTKNCGDVDLSSLTYVRTSAGNFVAQIPGFVTADYTVQKCLCSKYTYDNTNSAIDKTCWNNLGSIYIRDTDYTDPTDFKNSLSGVHLVYELAEPVTTPLTDAEISAFRGLRTYDSTTNITITDEPEFEINYLKNTENGQAVANIQTDLQRQIDDKITVSPPLTLTVAGWDSTTLQQTVTFVHDTTKRNVIDVDPASVEEWAACGIIARYETASNITFTCKSIPENALLFKVTSMGV